jgi:hypothetical protein
MNEFQFKFNDPISTIQSLLTYLSQFFISAFLAVIGDRNNMLDSTRDLILNYGLFYANNTAAMNTIINETHHTLRITENIE